jgi:geranylgeranyl diphosphate synthase, type II
MLDYPLREGKALRPALCIATCRALGGQLESVTRSAAVLELYHNAFLIHDDVEDGSEKRRDRPTLHRQQGKAVAINVGDAMLALALEPLLDNMRLVGIGPALRVLQLVSRMARESAEGQALELGWIQDGVWQLRDRDYLKMVYQKTAWYTFVAPMAVGALVAGVRTEDTHRLWRLATLLGIAFQIQDDILNIEGDEANYGKEILGDLWEGKHTLILLHALRHATAAERAHAEAVLRKPRPPERPAVGDAELPTDELVAQLLQAGEISKSAAARLRWHLAGSAANASATGGFKTELDIGFLKDLVSRAGSIEYARAVARRHASKARASLARALPWKRPSQHYDFIGHLIDYILDRDR